jgi:hypothetical protein
MQPGGTARQGRLLLKIPCPAWCSAFRTSLAAHSGALFVLFQIIDPPAHGELSNHWPASPTVVSAGTPLPRLPPSARARGSAPRPAPNSFEPLLQAVLRNHKEDGSRSSAAPLFHRMPGSWARLRERFRSCSRASWLSKPAGPRAAPKARRASHPARWSALSRSDIHSATTCGTILSVMPARCLARRSNVMGAAPYTPPTAPATATLVPRNPTKPVALP